MPRPTLESIRIYPELAAVAKDLAQRSGWRASEIYIVLVSWVKPRAQEPLCTLEEARSALEVVLCCATTLSTEALGGNALTPCHRTAEFRQVLDVVQNIASTEAHHRGVF